MGADTNVKIHSWSAAYESETQQCATTVLRPSASFLLSGLNFHIVNGIMEIASRHGGKFYMLQLGKCLLGERLRDAHMTQIELADKLNMKIQQVSDYKNGRKSMSLLTAIRFADALNCHVEDLYEIKRVPEHKKPGRKPKE